MVIFLRWATAVVGFRIDLPQANVCGMSIAMFVLLGLQYLPTDAVASSTIPVARIMPDVVSIPVSRPLLANHHAPNVDFTELRVDDRIVQPGISSLLPRAIGYAKRFSLAAELNNFSVSFSALSDSDPETHRYRYRLRGLDDDWRDVVGRPRSISLYSMPRGEYRLEFQASTSRGPWLDPSVGTDVEILPPWWDIWLFRSAYIATAILLMVALYRYRMRQVARQYNMRLEERDRERTRIARELHDSLLQGLHGLMFSLQAVRDLIPRHPDKAAELLDIALQRGDQALLEGRSALEDLRDAGPVEADLAHALAALTDDLKELSVGDPPELEVFVLGRARDLLPLARDEIYRIAREALRNAFTHSKGSKVECEITYGDKIFQLRVQDDGQGLGRSVFDAGFRPGHWGLPGMRERAEAAGGQLELWSAPGKGTEIKLTIPGARIYATRGLRQTLEALS